MVAKVFVGPLKHSMLLKSCSFCWNWKDSSCLWY